MNPDKYRVKPGSKVDLDDWDPDDKSEFDRSDYDNDLADPDASDKDVGEVQLPELNRRLMELQRKFYADGRHRLLVVLQATDTGGKDGTIRAVFRGTNPQGVKVTSFKRPTDQELAHDYLWRVHPHVPADGMISVFNRSHYEDVLVVRVHDIVPKERWKRRYGHIRDFEQLLVDEGTTIVKIYLNISKEEQAERLQARLDDPDKHWKFELGDLKEREHWDDYRQAFEAMLEETSTKDAPWYVVPANRKWYRNLVISQILIDTLESLDLAYPESDEDLSNVTIV